MFFGVYLSIHTGSTVQPYMWKDKDKQNNFKCRSAFGTGVMSRTGRVKMQSEEKLRGGQKDEDVGEKAAVSGQVASLISVLNQQPPQLFPQLPPSDEHWPLSAATPQREN